MEKKLNTKKVLYLLVPMILAGCSTIASMGNTPVSTMPGDTPIGEATYETIPPKRPNQTPTPTFIPTLSVKDKQQLLSNIFETNGNCDLPCYWGITPGVTTWEEAAQFLSRIGTIYGPGGNVAVPSYGPVFEDLEGDLGDMSPTFRVRGGIVIAILTNSGWVSRDFDYRLSGLLTFFGIPQEIWIEAVKNPSDDQPFYNLALWYPEKGAFLELFGNATLEGGNLSLCPQEYFTRYPYLPYLTLWDLAEEVDFKQFGRNFLGDENGWNHDFYQPLEMNSIDHLTNKDFYDIYREPGTDTCILVEGVNY